MGPSVRVEHQANRRENPLVLSPGEIKLGLPEMQYRDQLLVFLIGALGIGRGEFGAPRWVDSNFSVRHGHGDSPVSSEIPRPQPGKGLANATSQWVISVASFQLIG